ncbi:MAG: hypothetical protein HY755_11725 [Nitrospirae bacterium]|nr:hypothetical protein [Nitrospirota bacterium]
MKLYSLTMIFALILSLLLSTQGECKEQVLGEETTLLKIFNKETILAMGYWDFITEEYLCIVALHTEKHEDELINFKKLSVYKKIGDNLKKIYEYKTGNNFIGMYPLADANGDLVTIWVGGTAYHFNIFSLVDSEIKMVFEDGSKQLPEIVDIDNDGKDEILITQGSFLMNRDTKKLFRYPEETRIYRKEGDSYKLIKTVPWENRLNSLKRKKWK